MKAIRHIIFFLLAFAAVSTAMAAKPKVIAHRGLWNEPGSAQNSIRSFIKADSIGADYMEFDVWMTADSVLVVNHDAKYNGVDIETSPASLVCAQKLANGEGVPTLEEYLKLAATLKPSLICEIKSHNLNSNERECIRRTLEMVKKYGLEDRTEYVMFSKAGILELIKSVPEGTGVQYPRGDYLPEQIKFMGATGITYNIKVLKAHPDWIQRCHDLGLTVNVWTINTPEEMQWCIDNGADYITCNDPVTLQRMISKPQVIAHRGYWDTPGSAKNSIAGVLKADSIGAWGTEFDVWMTADSTLVINHDATINGVNIEKSKAKKVLKQRLANGEIVPTLEQLLTTAKGTDLHLICEIKKHDSRIAERACIRRTLKMMKDMGLDNRVEYVTFSLDGLKQLIAEAPTGTSVQYPGGDILPEQMKAFGGKGLNYRYSTLAANPGLIDRCHKAGIAVKAWSIKKPEEAMWCVENGVDFITSDDPANLLNTLKTL